MGYGIARYSTNLDLKRITVVTILEAIGITLWLLVLLNSPNIYSTTALLGGGVLFVALSIESTYGASAYQGTPKPFLSMGFAALEVVVWTNWFLLVGEQLYSAHGVGPAAFLLLGGLILLHFMERLTLAEGSLGQRLRVISFGVVATAAAEAIGGTVLWILLQQPEIVGTTPTYEIMYTIGGGVGLFILLFIEHMGRAEEMAAYAE